jgi:hypothetical protein
MAGLRAALPCPVDPVEAVGLDGDFLEAQAFAYLAARVLSGAADQRAGHDGVARPWAAGGSRCREGRRYPLGMSNPSGASVKPSKRNPGETVQDTSV